MTRHQHATPFLSIPIIPFALVTTMHSQTRIRFAVPLDWNLNSLQDFHTYPERCCESELLWATGCCVISQEGQGSGIGITSQAPRFTVDLAFPGFGRKTLITRPHIHLLAFRGCKDRLRYTRPNVLKQTGSHRAPVGGSDSPQARAARKLFSVLFVTTHVHEESEMVWRVQGLRLGREVRLNTPQSCTARCRTSLPRFCSGSPQSALLAVPIDQTSPCRLQQFASLPEHASSGTGRFDVTLTWQ